MIYSEQHQQAINVLADFYAEDFANYLAKREKIVELIEEYAELYANKFIPICDEESTYDLAVSLTERVTIGKLTQTPLSDGQFSINITE